MENQTPPQKESNWIRATLFAILISLIIISAGQYFVIYKTMDISNQTLSQAYDQQLVLTKNYTNLYQQTESMLVSTSQELNSTKVVLAQTQTLLARTQRDNITLRSQLSSLERGQNFTDKLSLMQQDQVKSYNDLETIKNQMQAWSGKVRDIDDGRAMIDLFQTKIKAVKVRIHELKRQATLAKIKAQKEQDRLALLNGNQGYVIKGGEIFKAPAVATAQAPKSDSGVKINVSFYEPQKLGK